MNPETDLKRLAVAVLGRNRLDAHEEDACLRLQPLQALLKALGLNPCSVSDVISPSHKSREAHARIGVN
jgi:hypothetical protein